MQLDRSKQHISLLPTNFIEEVAD